MYLTGKESKCVWKYGPSIACPINERTLLSTVLHYTPRNAEWVLVLYSSFNLSFGQVNLSTGTCPSHFVSRNVGLANSPSSSLGSTEANIVWVSWWIDRTSIVSLSGNWSDCHEVTGEYSRNQSWVVQAESGQGPFAEETQTIDDWDCQKSTWLTCLYDKMGLCHYNWF